VIQSRRIQRGKGYYGQCIHPGSFNKRMNWRGGCSRAGTEAEGAWGKREKERDGLGWGRATKCVGGGEMAGRSGCQLSPLLFTIYVADMDEMLKKAQAGESVVKREKVWSLAFADDMVILAKSVKERRNDESLGKYVRKKKLEVNVEKTKMMVFNKRKRKSEENRWLGGRMAVGESTPR
jgi:hypothetical protein